jgi:hypothetical protein
MATGRLAEGQGPSLARWQVRRDWASISYLDQIKSGPKLLIFRKSLWIFRIPPKAEVTGSNPVGRATRNMLSGFTAGPEPERPSRRAVRGVPQDEVHVSACLGESLPSSARAHLA